MNKKITLILTALLLVLCSIWWRLDMAWQWDFALLLKNPDDLPLEAAITQMAILPQMTTAFLAGGLLSLSSSALQQIVRNPLASDSTLAVSSGAQLALMAAAVFFPTAGLFGSFWVALVGTIGAMSLVLFIGKSNEMNPLTVILGGLIVNIVLGAFASVILLFYNDLLLGIMVWGSGSLLQDGWATTQALLGVGGFILVPFVLLYKPLTLLALDDDQARRLGVPVNLLRYTVLTLAAMATALVVSKVGIIGFIGLAGANCAALLGARHFIARLITAFFVGGGLLLLSDNLFSVMGQLIGKILPTGALTAVLGVPLLLYLIIRQRKSLHEEITPKPTALLPVYRLPSWRLPLLWLLGLLAILLLLQGFVQGLDGWGWNGDLQLIWQHRLPRSLSAMVTGAMLAVGGALLQILTRNPMASPEVLGVGSGTSLAVVVAFLLFPNIGNGGLLLAAIVGSLAVLLLIMWLSVKLSPSALLLVGIAMGALVGGVMAIIQLSPNPQLTAILSWLSGSTYYAQPEKVWLLSLAGIVLISTALLFVKPLRLLSLGMTVARCFGLPVVQCERLILLLVAVMSACATLAVGPLSFIGLMTPHLAKRLGAVTPDKQLPVSALLGAGLMLISDWLGRYLIFPYELGAGVIASLLGGIYFLLLIKQRN